MSDLPLELGHAHQEMLRLRAEVARLTERIENDKEAWRQQQAYTATLNDKLDAAYASLREHMAGWKERDAEIARLRGCDDNCACVVFDSRHEAAMAFNTERNRTLALKDEVARLTQERDEAMEILSPGRLVDGKTWQEVPTTLVERARWTVAALGSETDLADEATALRAEVKRLQGVLALPVDEQLANERASNAAWREQYERLGEKVERLEAEVARLTAEHTALQFAKETRDFLQRRVSVLREKRDADTALLRKLSEGIDDYWATQEPEVMARLAARVEEKP